MSSAELGRDMEEVIGQVTIFIFSTLSGIDLIMCVCPYNAWVKEMCSQVVCLRNAPFLLWCFLDD